jgi:hypothetical protein
MDMNPMKISFDPITGVRLKRKHAVPSIKAGTKNAGYVVEQTTFIYTMKTIGGC